MDREMLNAIKLYQDISERGAVSADTDEKMGPFEALTDEEKERLFAEVFNKAFTLAERLMQRPEYDATNRVLDLSSVAFSRTYLDAHFIDDTPDDVEEEPLNEDEKAFRVITLWPGGVPVGEASLRLNEDGLMRPNDIELYGRDRILRDALDALETLEVITEELATVVPEQEPSAS